jgi:hypothetical protein
MVADGASATQGPFGLAFLLTTRTKIASRIGVCAGLAIGERDDLCRH